MFPYIIFSTNSSDNYPEEYDTYAEAKAAEVSMSDLDIVIAGGRSYQYRSAVNGLIPLSASIHPSDPIINGLLVIVPRIAINEGWSDLDSVSTFADQLGCIWTQYYETPGPVIYEETGGPNGGPCLNFTTATSGMTSSNSNAITCLRNKAQVVAISHMLPDTSALNNDYWYQTRNNDDSAMRFGCKFSSNRCAVTMGRETSHTEWNDGQAYASSSTWLAYGGIGWFDMPDSQLSVVATVKHSMQTNSYNLGSNGIFAYHDAWNQSGAYGSGPTADTDSFSTLLWVSRVASFSFSGKATTFCLLATRPGEYLKQDTIAEVEHWLGLEAGLYS